MKFSNLDDERDWTLNVDPSWDEELEQDYIHESAVESEWAAFDERENR